MPHGVGNGGLSLRSVPAMLALSEQYGANSTDSEQEDFFYSALIEGMEQYRLPPRHLAYQFAVEVPCLDLEEGQLPGPGLRTLPHVPLGLHASW